MKRKQLFQTTVLLVHIECNIVRVMETRQQLNLPIHYMEKNKEEERTKVRKKIIEKGSQHIYGNEF